METTEDTRVDQLVQRLNRANSISDFTDLIGDLAHIEAVGDATEKIGDLRRAAFGGLRRLTFGKGDEAEAPILELLLPLCLQSADRQFGSRSIFHPAELLRDWLNDFDHVDRQRLREKAFPAIIAKLDSNEPIDAVVTSSYLGFRDDRIADALQAVVSRFEGEVGDRALRALISLGIPPSKRRGVLEEVHRRAGRRWNVTLVACLIELVDASNLEPIFRWLEREGDFQKEDDSGSFLEDYTIQVIGRIADRYSEQTGLQDAVWDRVLALHSRDPGQIERALRRNSSLAGNIDTSGVIAAHLALLDRSEGKPADLMYYRLEELVRPRQLLGWEQAPDSRAVETLLRDASISSAMRGRWGSEHLRLKLAAWDCLLSLGRSDIPHLFENALQSETSGYAIGDLCEVAACTELSSLPPEIQSFIADTSSRIVVEGNERLIAQVGAIHVAQAARSREALDALLSYKPIQSEGILLSLVDALSDCVSTMLSRGDAYGERALWEGIGQGNPTTLRTASAATLANLLCSGHIAASEVERYVGAIEDESLKIYARRTLIEAAGFLEARPPDSRVISALMRIARDARRDPTHDEESGWPEPRQVAIGSLARLGVLAEEPELLKEFVGLKQAEGQWDVAAGASPNPHTLGILYASNPDRFAPAVAGLLLGSDWGTIAALRPHLEDAEAPAIVVRALASRIQRSNMGRIAEPELLPLLARLDPKQLIAEQWKDLQNRPPQVRAALADAIKISGSTDSNASRLLVDLMGDGHYGVRRAAYRAASSQPSLLASYCQLGASWAKDAMTVEVRERAAEAAAWLLGPDRTEQIEALASDPEPTVRDAFTRSNLERRHREMSALYVDRLLQVESAGDIPNAWKYGRALGRIGDDLTIEALNARRYSRDLSPAIRHWLSRVVKQVRKHWDEVTRKWPKPWFHHRGRLEEVSGVLVAEDGREAPFQGWLFLEAPDKQLGVTRWGGWTTNFKHLSTASVLKVDGRAPVEIMENFSSWSNDPDRSFMTFLGQGPYPVNEGTVHG